MNWFRFYSEAIDDKKLRRIARETDSPFACVLGIWTIILSLASESCIRGALMIGDGVPATADDVSDIAGCNVTVTLQKLIVTGLVTDVDGVLRVSSWDKRQYTSDSSADRVRNHRSRQNTPQNGQKPPEMAESTPDVTPVKRYSNVTVTPPDTDTDTDTDTETEEILTAYAVSTPAEQPSPEQAPKAKRAAAKPDTTLLLFDPVQDIILVEVLTAHYESVNRKPPAKFQNTAQRDGYRMAAAFLGPDKTRRAVTQCVVGNRYAIGDIVTSLLRWVDNEKRGGTRTTQPAEREPAYKRAIREFLRQEGMAPNGVT